MIPRFIKSLVPVETRSRIRHSPNILARKRKSPRMLYGYSDSTGDWRPRVRMSDSVFLYHPDKIEIEDNVFVWHYTILDGTGGIKIGTGSQIGAWVAVLTHSSHIAIRLYGDHFNEVPESEKKGFKVAPVNIGRYVFLGAKVIILPGVSIGDGAIVSAGSIVKDDVGPFEIVAGNPASVVGNAKDLDKKYLDDPTLMEWYQEWQSD